MSGQHSIHTLPTALTWAKLPVRLTARRVQCDEGSSGATGCGQGLCCALRKLRAAHRMRDNEPVCAGICHPDMSALTAVGRRRHVPAECTDSQWLRRSKYANVSRFCEKLIATGFRFLAESPRPRAIGERSLTISNQHSAVSTQPLSSMLTEE